LDEFLRFFPVQLCREGLSRFFGNAREKLEFVVFPFDHSQAIPPAFPADFGALRVTAAQIAN
jgi:hypothetical protein